MAVVGSEMMPNGSTQHSDLDDLICERLWVERKMHERLYDLVLRHKEQYQRWPNVVFLSGRFEEWLHHRGAHRLDVEIEGEGFIGIASEGMLICCGPVGVELAVGYKEGSEQTNLAAMMNVAGLQTYVTEPPEPGEGEQIVIGGILPAL